MTYRDRNAKGDVVHLETIFVGEVIGTSFSDLRAMRQLAYQLGKRVVYEASPHYDGRPRFIAVGPWDCPHGAYDLFYPEFVEAGCARRPLRPDLQVAKDGD